MTTSRLSSFILTFLASYTGRWSTVPPPHTGARLRSSAQSTAGAWSSCPPRRSPDPAQCTSKGARSAAPDPARSREISRRAPHSAHGLHGGVQPRRILRLRRRNILTRVFLVKGAVCASVCVCALQDNRPFKNFCCVRFTSPGARASSWVDLSDTRALAPNHAHTFPLSLEL